MNWTPRKSTPALTYLSEHDECIWEKYNQMIWLIDDHYQNEVNVACTQYSKRLIKREELIEKRELAGRKHEKRIEKAKLHRDKSLESERYDIISKH
jgi:hypothetical protein